MSAMFKCRQTRTQTQMWCLDAFVISSNGAILPVDEKANSSLPDDKIDEKDTSATPSSSSLTSSSDPVIACPVCKETKNLKKRSRCKITSYCSTQCQITGWTTHRKTCAKPKQETHKDTADVADVASNSHTPGDSFKNHTRYFYWTFRDSRMFALGRDAAQLALSRELMED